MKARAGRVLPNSLSCTRAVSHVTNEPSAIREASPPSTRTTWFCDTRTICTSTSSIPLSRSSKIETFVQFLLFAAEHDDRGASVLIHCNQGESRAPTLALLFLAKHLRAIPAGSFSAARAAFAPLCREYRPGRGIQQFLETNWGTIIESGV